MIVVCRFLVIVGVTAVVGGCRKTEGPVRVEEPSPATSSPATPSASGETPTRLDIGVPMDEPDRWLFVEGALDGAAGGWASGSFDPQRNKLSIETKDVTKFAVDMSRVRVDWRKLVILSIDGKNSELRKRDFDRYHFARTDYGEWVVVEP